MMKLYTRLDAGDNSYLALSELLKNLYCVGEKCDERLV